MSTVPSVEQSPCIREHSWTVLSAQAQEQHIQHTPFDGTFKPGSEICSPKNHCSTYIWHSSTSIHKAVGLVADDAESTVNVFKMYFPFQTAIWTGESSAYGKGHRVLRNHRDDGKYANTITRRWNLKYGSRSVRGNLLVTQNKSLQKVRGEERSEYVDLAPNHQTSLFCSRVPLVPTSKHTLSQTQSPGTKSSRISSVTFDFIAIALGNDGGSYCICCEWREQKERVSLDIR